MTVAELLKKLGAAFPAFNAGALEAWALPFRGVCANHEGPVLAAAYTAVLTEFSVKTSKSLFPVPADFSRHLPGKSLKLSGGPAIDFKRHGEKMRQLMQRWRLEQGNRASNGIREIMRALEVVAEPIASQHAWAQAPEGVLLSRKQVRLAYHRAISAQRRIEHGKPEGIPTEAWWEQIQSIAARWKIETTREEWTAKTSEAQAA